MLRNLLINETFVIVGSVVSVTIAWLLILFTPVNGVSIAQIIGKNLRE